MTIGVIPQSIKLTLVRGAGETNVSGEAHAIIRIPGTFGVNADGSLVTGRTISGGWAYFANQADGDYVWAEVRDDDDLLGGGAGQVLDTFADSGVAAANQGWYFPGTQVLELRPLVSDDPTDLPSGMYLHIIAQKANPATSDTLYVNVHWGIRIR